MPRLIERIDELNLTGVMLVLANANITHLKKRDNTRLLLQLALKGIEVLKRERDSIGSDFEQIAVQYFDLASHFCFKGKHEPVIDEMNKQLGIDVIQLVQKLNPFSVAIKQ